MKKTFKIIFSYLVVDLDDTGTPVETKHTASSVVDALNEKDARFQFSAKHPDVNSDDIVSVKEVVLPVQNTIVRVHFGILTVNLSPHVASVLGYNDGDRIKSEPEFAKIVRTMNLSLIMDRYVAMTGATQEEVDLITESEFLEWFQTEGQYFNTEAPQADAAPART